MNEHALTLNSNQLCQVRALLYGTKTQHRLPIVPQPPNDEVVGPEWFEPAVEDRDGYLRAGKPIFGIWDRHGEFGLKCPWQVGDRLWVREAWMEADDRQAWDIPGSGRNSIVYRADVKGCDTSGWGWKPSIFMPREASRITLEITGIRAERIKEITREDIIAEGISPRPLHIPKEQDVLLRSDFRLLWDSINEKRGFGWDANPLVWVLSLRRIEP